MTIACRMPPNIADDRARWVTPSLKLANGIVTGVSIMQRAALTRNASFKEIDNIYFRT